ncbi:phospholipid/cholesterol/gamma-HCH transport system ATP-binding protein [Azospirillaceae bacterium]
MTANTSAMSIEPSASSRIEPPVIQVSGLVTRFGAHIIHDQLDLDVWRGEVLGVVGGSGSGKSVLLKIITGLLRPSAGRIEVLGHDVQRLDRRGRVSLQAMCGVLFQDGALFSSLTVAENIRVPLVEHTDLSSALIEEVIRVKIALVGLPPDAARKYPSQLSGGMRKRAGLARALALDPEILFLDEPTAGLDPIGAAAFDGLIGDLRRGLGLTVFMVTHDLDSLAAICDRIAVLIDQRLLVGSLENLQRETNPWIRDYFSGPRGRAALHHNR